MKKRELSLCVMMVIAMAVTSVGLTGCSNDDGDSDAQSLSVGDMRGTWVSLDRDAKTLNAVLTFSSGKSVEVMLEGAWYWCNVEERTQNSITMTGMRILMQSFNDFGDYVARRANENVTIKFYYKRDKSQLIIDNITVTPNVNALKSQYVFEFDKVYEGSKVVF